MNRSLLPGLSRDFINRGSAAATIGLAQEKMTARAAGAMVRPATEQQTSPTVCRAA
jgi:hypothetical protein